MCVCVCVCVRACVRACVRLYALRIVSTDTILCFINTFIIIIYLCKQLLHREKDTALRNTRVEHTFIGHESWSLDKDAVADRIETAWSTELDPCLTHGPKAFSLKHVVELN